MAAGLATLNALKNTAYYEQLENHTSRLLQGLTELAKQAGIPLLCQHAGGLFGLLFTEQTQVLDFNHVMQCDQKRFNQFFHGMLKQGIYLAPSAFESGFLSIAHDDDIIDKTLTAAHVAMQSL
jgi:glutamate-1-semialdehyde 2,1-aminomutase